MINQLYSPLRGFGEWAQSTDRPVLIVGNGPSAMNVDATRIPENAVVVRMNAFMFEPRYVYGNRVDGFFWAIGRRWLQVAAAVAAETKTYRFGTFFAPDDVINSGLLAFADENEWLKVNLHPRRSHFELINAVPALRDWFLPRKARIRKGLPTQGMQAIATMLIMGFREIYVSGVDFYQSMAVRYAFEYPRLVKLMTPTVHTKPGYEGEYHSIELDLAFFRQLRATFPNARIYSLCPESFFSNFVPLAPTRSTSVAGVRQPSAQHDDVEVSNVSKKDNGSFLAALQERLLAPYAAPRNLTGGVERLANGRALVWNWQPTQPERRRAISVNRGSGDIVEYDVSSRIHELELSGVGDGAHGTILPLGELLPKSSAEITYITDSETGQLLDGGLIGQHCFPLRELLTLPQCLVIGFGVVSDIEERAIAALPAACTIKDLKARRFGEPVDHKKELDARSNLPSLMSVLERQEIEVIIAGLARTPNRLIWVAGLLILGHDQTALFQLAKLAPSAFNEVFGALRAGKVSMVAAQRHPVLSQIEHLMKPVSVFVQGDLPEGVGDGQHASICSLIARTLPMGTRIDPTLWEVDTAFRLDEIVSGTDIIIDGHTLDIVCYEIFERLVKVIQQRNLKPVVVIESLEPDWMFSNFRVSLAERLAQLAELGGRFFTDDIHIGRILKMIIKCPSADIYVGRLEEKLSSCHLIVRSQISVLVLTDILSEVETIDLRRKWSSIAANRESKMKVDFAHNAGSSFDYQDKNIGLTFGLACPRPSVMRSYDVIIVGHENVGLNDPVRQMFAMQDDCPPVLAIKTSGLALFCPYEAVYDSVEDALRAVAEEPVGSRLPAARPASSLSGAFGAAVELLNFALPGGDVSQWTVSSLASVVTQPVASDDGLRLDCRLSIIGDGAGSSQVIQVHLSNRSDNVWLPGYVDDKGGAVLVLDLFRVAANTRSTFRHDISGDVPPGGNYFYDFSGIETALEGLVIAKVSIIDASSSNVVFAVSRFFSFNGS